MKTGGGPVSGTCSAKFQVWPLHGCCTAGGSIIITTFTFFMRKLLTRMSGRSRIWRERGLEYYSGQEKQEERECEANGMSLSHHPPK